MSLSNTVKTLLIDPRSHSNQRTEFRLEDAYYASSLKLVDVGVYDAGNADKLAVYPQINGVMQCIKNIYLYSDTTLIDSLQNIPQYSAIDSLKTSNQGSNDMNRSLLLNGMGFQFSRTETDRTATTDTRPGIIESGSHNTLQSSPRYYSNSGSLAPQNSQITIAADDDEQSGAVLLSRLLQFLKTVSVLPNLPRLRLVLEWDTNIANYYNDPTAPIATPNLQVIRPTLVAEQIMNAPEAAPEGMQIPYMATIVERFTVPEVTVANAAVPSRNSFKSQAFNAKFVRDLTFFNLPKSDLADVNKRVMTRLTRSVAQRGEQLQLVVNNNNHLPDQGIVNAAQKFHYFNDAQQPLNLPLVAGTDAVKDASNNIIDAESAVPAQFSVTSVKVGKRVDDLRVEYQRLYGNQASQRESMTLVVFGTVARTMTVKGDQVRISY